MSETADTAEVRPKTLHVRVPGPLVEPTVRAAADMALSPNHFLKVCLAEKLASGGYLPSQREARS